MRARHVVLAFSVGLSLQSATLAVPADNPRSNHRLQISAGVFIPTDVSSGTTADPGFTITGAILLEENSRFGSRLSFRYSRYDFNSGATAGHVELFSPTADFRWRLRENGPTYVSLGIGYLYGQNDFGRHHSTFAYSAGIGHEIGGRLFIEALALRGTKDGDHGFAISIGSRL